MSLLFAENKLEIQTIVLKNKYLELGIVPALGGIIRFFNFLGTVPHFEIFRAMADKDLYALNSERAACFPLIPYSGRIKNGEFCFHGKLHKVETFLREPNGLHGEGWRASWQVEEQTEESLKISFVAPQRAYPFAYRGEQFFQLEEDRLKMQLAVENREEVPIPIGLGFHPWFNWKEPVLKASFDTVWETTGNYLFSHKSPCPDKWNFQTGALLRDKELVNGFSGWDGRALLEDRATGMTLEIKASEALSHLVLYTLDPTGDFCIEPVSHSVDSFNLEAEGVEGNGTIVLAPQSEMRIYTEFKVDSAGSKTDSKV